MKREFINMINRLIQNFSRRVRPALVPFAILASGQPMALTQVWLNHLLSRRSSQLRRRVKPFSRPYRATTKKRSQKSLEDQRNSLPLAMETRIRSSASCSLKSTRRCTV